MERTIVETTLTVEYPIDVISKLLDSYLSAIQEFRKENWQYAINEMGHFIECSRMMIEHKLGGSSVSLSTNLDKFNDAQLKKWESSIGVDEYRVIIPRVLYSMACIRNKRGAIHTSKIDPNNMDAFLLLAEAKWVLAEFFRLSSKLSFDETYAIIMSITNKEIPLLWHINDITRVMDPTMSTKDQILVLLYSKNKQTDKELQKSVGYKNVTNFRGHIWNLHKNRLIEYDGSSCIISTLGIKYAEKIISSFQIDG